MAITMGLALPAKNSTTQGEVITLSAININGNWMIHVSPTVRMKKVSGRSTNLVLGLDEGFVMILSWSPFFCALDPLIIRLSKK